MGIASMTGFGAGRAVEKAEEISVELKSVNGKFCEVKARLPRELASLEPVVVRFIKDRVSRGSVDVFVRRSSPEGLVSEPKIDAALVASYAVRLKQAAKDAGIDDSLGIRDLLGLEGVATLTERGVDLEAAQQALTQALTQALVGLAEVRAREGASLQADLATRTATLRGLVARVAELAPAATDTFRERLHNRIKELAPEIAVDPARLEQEVVIYADRSDVAEEITRLGAHLDELQRLLEADGPVGRRLDFLLQEINREINTTGSKSQSTDVARLVVELKAESERLREQVQNVE